MTTLFSSFKRAVTALWIFVMAAGAAAAQDPERLESLFVQLKSPDLENWEEVEGEIWRLWSQSGSPSADFLLERGRQSLEAGELTAAIDHFSALTDHAPDFAEGYNARATAYYQAGNFGLSLRDIEATLALNPQHFGAITGLALILEELGEKQQALDAYRAVHAIHPHRPNVKDAIDRLERDLGGTAL